MHYTRFSKIRARPGMGSRLVEILLQVAAALQENPDNFHYLTSASEIDIDEIWVFEVWRDRSAHAASLTEARVQAIAQPAHHLIQEITVAQELRFRGPVA